MISHFFNQTCGQTTVDGFQKLDPSSVDKDYAEVSDICLRPELRDSSEYPASQQTTLKGVTIRCKSCCMFLSILASLSEYAYSSQGESRPPLCSATSWLTAALPCASFLLSNCAFPLPPPFERRRPQCRGTTTVTVHLIKSKLHRPYVRTL